jgi:hypothetical protein
MRHEAAKKLRSKKADPSGRNMGMAVQQIHEGGVNTAVLEELEVQ